MRRYPEVLGGVNDRREAEVDLADAEGMNTRPGRGICAEAKNRTLNPSRVVVSLRASRAVSTMQHIIVCTEDSVLAKKVRFLLARDECEVEILPNPTSLGERLARGGLSMLVLSRFLEGEDAIEWLARLEPEIHVPTTLVLGGAETMTADFIHLIPDPIDTQAIYRIASEVLAAEEAASHETTHMGIDAPVRRRRAMGDGGRRNDIAYADTTAQALPSRIDEVDDDQIGEALDLDEQGTAAVEMPGLRLGHINPGADPASSHSAPVLGGMLEPARFAKVLYECWAQQTTGALIVARERETLTISFEDGGPIHVQSSIPGNPLGRALVARGRISEAQYGEGAKRSIEKGLLLGPALVELGYFTIEELGEELGKLANEQIVSCFEARQGAFEFDPKRSSPTSERPYRLDIPHILAQGLRGTAEDDVVRMIVGDVEHRYFKLKRSIEELAAQYPLDDRDQAFLAFNGRAYNVADAAEICQMPRPIAHSLMALLIVTDEVADFTPGVVEFEARIREERQRSRDLRSSDIPPVEDPPPSSPAIPLPSHESEQPANGASSERSPFEAPMPAEPPPPPPPPIPMAHPQPQPAPVGPNGEEIPAMPVPADDEDGLPVRPLVFAKSLPRGPDGSALETPERSLSREHFQRGVALLGQGNFANAEEAFRDAVALCSEEHVYLIGLARAIYYNPAYRAEGKVPVLKSIVGRADHLAPDDKRVATLRSWVQHAEAQMPATT